MLFVVCMLLYNNKLFKTVKTEPHMDKLCPLFWRSPSLIQLRELQDKYVECLEILHEAQEELKNFRNKSLPPSTTRRFHSLGLFPMVSSCSLSAATPAPCPASASIPLTFVPLCPGFSGRWDRGHHEEGITDGWSRRRRTKVFIFSQKTYVTSNSFTKKGLGFMHRKRWEWYMHLYFFQSRLQAPTKASFPDGEKPEPDASAAFVARSVPSQHPGIQSDVLPHVESLQPCGHTALQLHLWGWGGKWHHPGQQDQQYSGESRWWVGKQI